MAAMPRVPAEAGAMEEVDGHRESWDTGLVAVVAGTGVRFGAYWRRAGPEVPHQRSRPRVSSLAAGAAGAGIAGGQQAGLDQVGGTACAGQGDQQVNHRQRSPILGGDRM